MSAKDHWESGKYEAAAGFVPQLTTTVLKYLDPQPGERILDIGCGNGTLTLDIAKVVEQKSGEVLGLDASPAMIQAATALAQQRSVENCTFRVADCADLPEHEKTASLNGSWDKVFSNAALHWILGRARTRMNVLHAAQAALKPGGKFVFECGGAGNVAEMVAAMIAAMVANGASLEKARGLIPWYFASEAWMERALKDVGFDVDKVELEYRPTKLMPEDSAGGGGLEGWIRLFGGSILEGFEDERKDKIVTYIAEILESVITREDGTQWLGYTRLRGVATKR